MSATETKHTGAPPRENLVRAMPGGFELRAAEEPDAMPTMVVDFIRFNEWTRIDSMLEGTFMERISPGASDKTIAENRSNMRVLFQHGRDPHIGDKVLGPISELEASSQTTRGTVPLLDTSYNRDLLPGLERGLYGASFRFRVMREEIEEAPGVSDHNPDGLPERTIKEMQIMEFGPVTFPAYAGATAGVRSLTDEFVLNRLTEDPSKLAAIIDYNRGTAPPGSDGTSTVTPTPVTAPSEPTPTPVTSAPERRVEPTKEELHMADIEHLNTLELLAARLDEIATRQAEIDNEFGVRELSPEARTEWEDIKDEKVRIEARMAEKRERIAEVQQAKAGGTVEPAVSTFTPRTFQTIESRVPENIYDLGAYRTQSRDADDELSLMRSGAMKAVEGNDIPGAVDEAKAKGHVAKLLRTIDDADPETGKMGGELARRILNTGSPLYRRAFGKYLAGRGMTPEEQRALSVGTGSAGGFAVVYTLDPTIVPTSNFSVNPYRALARIETISGTNEWKAVTSGAVSFTFTAEATEAGDGAPTLAQPDIIVEKAQAYVPFSIELGQDWGRLEAEMAQLLQDGKDDIEATKYTLGAGHGSTEPKGIITAATTTVTAGGSGAFAIADVYKLFEGLPPRFRPRSQFLANLFTIDKIRQFDTSGGSGVWMGPQGLQPAADSGDAGTIASSVGVPLLGRNVYESTAMDAVLTTGSKIVVVGDWRYFVIVDRVGMSVEVVPLVVGTNHRPTGQRGLYAYYRTSSDVLSANAFRVLVTG